MGSYTVVEAECLETDNMAVHVGVVMLIDKVKDTSSPPRYFCRSH